MDEDTKDINKEADAEILENDELSYEENTDEDSGTPADAMKKVKKLKDEIKKLKEEKQEYLDGWQRERAQFANYKKDEGDRDSRLRRIFEESFVSSLLPALDSFDMATGNAEAWNKVDANWRIGVEHIYKQLKNVLEEYEVETIEKTDVHFNPEEHLAIEHADEERDEETVLKIIQKGYKTKNHIIRPAKVAVSKTSSK
jgi:molecular chaperone GrpE